MATKKGNFTITDHSKTDETGKVTPLFVVRWGNSVQNFKTLEAAEKFCENYGKVDLSVRQVPKNQPKEKV